MLVDRQHDGPGNGHGGYRLREKRRDAELPEVTRVRRYPDLPRPDLYLAPIPDSRRDAGVPQQPGDLSKDVEAGREHARRRPVRGQGRGVPEIEVMERVAVLHVLQDPRLESHDPGAGDVSDVDHGRRTPTQRGSASVV